MENLHYKEEFIRFMYECGVLKFGEFTLKSGRIAPYFLNTGEYKTGAQLAKLGEYYARCLEENKIEVQTLFGPAYKGITLASSAAIGLYHVFGKEVNYCFDRKEAKDHGEGGILVGKQLKDGETVAIIEDVMTSGKALRESVPKLKAVADVNITAMVISVDRMEKGLGETTAVQDAFTEFGIRVYSIVTIDDIIEAIRKGVLPCAEYLDKIQEYRRRYGVISA